MTGTEKYIGVLTRCKAGELTLLRKHAGRGIDEAVEAFDLFAGLWWPIRAEHVDTPRRTVAWLVAKLYACCPITHEPGATLAQQLHDSQPHEQGARVRYRQRIDCLLTASLDRIEPELGWALRHIADAGLPVDWVALTNDLSIWEREHTRLSWAKAYLGITERMGPC